MAERAAQLRVLRLSWVALEAALFEGGFGDGVALSGRGVGEFHRVVHAVSGLVDLLSPLLVKSEGFDREQARGDLNGVAFDAQGVDVDLARVPHFIRVDLNPGGEGALGDVLGCDGVGDESLGRAAVGANRVRAGGVAADSPPLAGRVPFEV